MGLTKIEWTERTENPCKCCSLGCPFCYGKKLCRRLPMMMAGTWLKKRGIPYKYLPLERRMELYRSTPVWCEDCYNNIPHFHPEVLDKLTPKQKPQKIFINSLYDWNDPQIKDRWLIKILQKMIDCKQHTFQILSKRPEGYSEWVFPENVWLGTTITSEADQHRLKTLLDTPNNNLKFVSYEPMLGLITCDFEGIGWAIAGAETGNRKDKVIPQALWIENFIVRTSEYEVPIFFKNSLLPYWNCIMYQEFPEV